ncbi:hypothetical protein Efla_007043 [Eimeria flavescens]
MTLTATAAAADATLEGEAFLPPPRCFGLGQLTRHNVLMLKELNLATIPVVYGDDYYNRVVEYPTFCRLAYLGDVMVGAITCRIELNPDGSKQLYIMTLSVLKPYRHLGIATQLLGYILELASNRGDIKQATLHVWEANAEARHFYEVRGFELVSRMEDHYPNMDPPHALFMQCALPWALKGKVPLPKPDFDATKHNLAKLK